MPRFDLRLGIDAIKPLAAFDLLAVMCHPSDRVRREQMLASVRREVGNEGRRRKPISNDEFLAEVNLVSARAYVAGSLLLTRLQLFQNGYPPSLNLAMRLLAPLLPKWTQETAPTWHKAIHFGHHPKSRRKMLEAHQRFRSVAHFWAALVYAGQVGRKDILPDSRRTLPTFLAYADGILKMASALPYRRGDTAVSISRREVWTFTIPAGLCQSQKISALPLSDEQLKILNDR